MAVRLAYTLTKPAATHFLLTVDSHGDGDKDTVYLPANTYFGREGACLRMKAQNGTSIRVKFEAGNDGDTETFNGEDNIDDALIALEAIL